MGTKFFYLIVVLALGAAGFFGYQYYQQQLVSSDNYQQPATEQLATEAVAAVGKLIILPSGETPAVAVITDVAKLKADQLFYADAENGDQVLIYEQARKAIIYSPRRQVIVNVGPIFVQPEAATSTGATAGAPTEVKK